MSFIHDLFMDAEQLNYQMQIENSQHYIKVSRYMYELLVEYCKKYGVTTDECYPDGSEIGKLYGIRVVLDENIETWEIV